MIKRIFGALKTVISRRLVFKFDGVEFTYSNLSLKRLKNWFLTELAYTLKSDRVWALPTHLQVEPTSLCNLRCPVCHVVTDNKPRGNLDFVRFREIIDEVGDYILLINLWGWGEPFMNSDTFEMIRYAENKGIKVITSTNGHFFESKKDVDRLIDSSLSVLIFALDATDKETYNKYRHGGNFDRVLRGLELLMLRRKERGALLPRVNLRMLVTRYNEDQIHQMKELAQRIGVDILTFKTLNVFDNEADGESLIPWNKEYRRFQYDDMGRPIQIGNTCKKLWNHPVIYRDGIVVPCDYHTGHELALGNVFNNGRSFTNIWFGKEYRRLRARFVRGDTAGFRCDSCALNFAPLDRCVPTVIRFRGEVDENMLRPRGKTRSVAAFC
jgi:radical SAM protein with 4Fe4S-binding SPASM domain